MQIVCLDLEGVLAPEIWIEVAAHTGIEALRRTTREEPDYDTLMRYRLEILEREGLRLPDIQRVVGDLGALPGARAFVDDLRERYQVVILSDTFYEFAQPIMRQLGWPTLFCHRLQVDAGGRITGYRLRMHDQKRAAVNAFRALNLATIAAGDSYNDTAMLGAADAGIFFRPPPKIVAEFPQFPVTHEYAELRGVIDAASRRIPL